MERSDSFLYFHSPYNSSRSSRLKCVNIRLVFRHHLLLPYLVYSFRWCISFKNLRFALQPCSFTRYCVPPLVCYSVCMKAPPLYCATCGKLLLRRKHNGRLPRYCLRSGECRQRAYRRRVKAKQSAKQQANRLGHLSQESFEWYTPHKYINAAKRVFGEVDLDPASSREANRMVKAKRFYDQTTDGLTKTWKAQTVWLNPPYCKAGNTSNQDRWTSKLLREYNAGNVKEAILLVTSATETIWFHRLLPYPMCFVKGRIHFTTPAGKHGGATKGSVFVYLGERRAMFKKVFSRYGFVKMA